jgi:hypothetical protein
MVTISRILRRLMFGLVMLGLCLPAETGAQTRLGDQRVGTSSGSFLRIGVGARPAAMAGAYVAICDDITACAWNPAGLVHLAGSEVAFNYTDWPADISYSHVCYGLPVTVLDGAVAIQFGSLSTDLIETTEYHPYGTGREFTFADWLVGLTVAKRFTDKFSGGFAVKYVREELGVEVGGPSTDALVLDAGTYYEIGPKNMRLAVALMNFGPDMEPDGVFTKKIGVTTGESLYQGFAPATEFKFGIAIEPVTTPYFESVVDIEMLHPADNAETFRFGAEAVIMQVFALRIGYDEGSDEMKTNLGAGAVARVFSRQARFDYAASLTDHLGTVHRLSITLGL